MKFPFIIIALVVLLSSCSKNEQYSNMDIKAFGHGGSGNQSTLPMNSLESMLACYHAGGEGNELDLQLTKDSVLIAMHSSELAENTNLKGKVNSMTWTEIENGYYTENPYLKYKIVSLEQVLQYMGSFKNYYFTLDCKLYQSETEQYNEVFSNQLASIINKYDLTNRVFIESDNEAFLQLLKAKNNLLRLFIYTGSIADGILICEKNAFYGITISTRNATKEEIQQVHAKNLKVAIWNTHTKKDNKEAVEKGPDFIQTEKISYLLSLLSK